MCDIVLLSYQGSDMRIDELHWYNGNIEHISKHGISPIEVEDICSGPHLVYPASYGRYDLYGQTEHGKYVRVILRCNYDRVFEVRTAYEMTERQKKNYRRQMKRRRNE